MAKIFGKSYTRRELSRRVGDISQIAGVRLYGLIDGPARGVRCADFRTGSGLQFTCVVDRGLDISHASHCGRPLGWISGPGEVAPARFEPEGASWLRTFAGGLLTTCGLTYCGAPCVDQGKALGLHGRISHTVPAEVSVQQRWEGEDFVMTVSGVLREAEVFGENLVLTRHISASLGESRIFVHDRVENRGFKETPLMILYHINPGFPVLDAGSRLLAPSAKVTPRDAEAEKGKDSYAEFSQPIEAFREQVFYHDMKPCADGRVTAALVNRGLGSDGGFGLYVKYKKSQLPVFTEWKMVGEGEYVMGMEPGNCHVEGRAKERERGTLQTVSPGEERDFQLEIGVLAGGSEIEAAQKAIEQAMRS